MIYNYNLDWNNATFICIVKKGGEMEIPVNKIPKCMSTSVLKLCTYVNIN